MRNADRTRIHAGSAEQLDSIATTIEDFIRLQDDGQAPDVEVFCARHPVAAGFVRLTIERAFGRILPPVLFHGA